MHQASQIINLDIGLELRVSVLGEVSKQDSFHVDHLFLLEAKVLEES